MSKANFFRFKRKLDAAGINIGATSKPPPSKQTKKDDEGKKQTTISKFFVSNQKPKRSEKNDVAQDKVVASAGESSSPALEKKEVVLCTSTLNKLESFKQNHEDRESASTSSNDSLEKKTTTASKRVNLSNFASKHSPTKPQPKVQVSSNQNPIKYTPFEQQIVELKSQNPGIFLLVESGYKYRIFGDDAKIASEELNIMANMDHNFLTASIPTHRLHVHVRRLVENGHKVGVVKQTETTALKANSSTKSSLFSRELAAIYTKATLIGEDVEPVSGNCQDEDGPQEQTTVCSMACIAEIQQQTGKTPQVHDIGIVVVEPATGEAIFDSFTDLPNRSELEKRLNHLRPVEIIISTNISTATKHLLSSRSARIERLPDSSFELTEATSLTSDFVTDECKSRLGELSPCVVQALGALISYLREFRLTKALSPNRLTPFTTRGKILQMDAGTVKNLEIFETDLRKNKGSLAWVLDHTKTSFGSRLLKRWVSQPLCTLEALVERQDAVCELLRPEVSEIVEHLRGVMAKLPDLEKDLTCVLHGKINTAGFASLVSCMTGLFHDLKSREIMIWSTFSNDHVEILLTQTMEHLQGVVVYQANLNLEAAKAGDKTKLLKDWTHFPEVETQLEAIKNINCKLHELRGKIAKSLGMFSVNYTTVSDMEYLIELKNNVKVPTSWAKVSSTKQVTRWRPPEVISLFSELCRHRELLSAACNCAWQSTLEEFSKNYHTLKLAVSNLAEMDVLMSLAQVSRQEGFCRPEIHDGDPGIEITQGKHPMLSHLLSVSQELVANDTSLGLDHERCMIITGPNMGGKSSYIRQVALLVVMAQIGCYVPAERAKIGLVDAIFTRMGSKDELHRGRSTLLVELEEASVMLRQATQRSLTILDELGRGTSSCDGAAIAVATLQHVVTEVKCLTLFVTHYPVVMTVEQQFPSLVRNYHMGFALSPATEEENGVEVLTFLYQLERGGAHHSYGINVARLANLPTDILTRAAEKAQQLQHQVIVSSQRNKNFHRIWSYKNARELEDGLNDLKV